MNSPSFTRRFAAFVCAAARRRSVTACRAAHVCASGWRRPQSSGHLSDGHRLKCLTGNRATTDRSNGQAVPCALAPYLDRIHRLRLQPPLRGDVDHHGNPQAHPETARAECKIEGGRTEMIAPSCILRRWCARCETAARPRRGGCESHSFINLRIARDPGRHAAWPKAVSASLIDSSSVNCH